jgi:hypothetical protein
MLSFPAIFPILFLVIFDVPSWIIGTFLIFIMLFHMDIRFETVSRKDKSKIKTVVKEDRREKAKPSLPIDSDHELDEGGYHEITIG